MALTGRVDVADHLQRLSLADLFVDTPQYNGGTTGAAAAAAAAALVWCGVAHALRTVCQTSAAPSYAPASSGRSGRTSTAQCEAQGSTVRRKWSARLSAALGDSLSR